MTEKTVHSSQMRYSCQMNHYPGGTSCVHEGKVELDGLMLCGKHAVEAKLEGQITCWNAMLAHIDLWLREANRRDRPEIAQLLEVERFEVLVAIERAAIELHLARGGSGAAQDQPLNCS